MRPQQVASHFVMPLDINRSISTTSTADNYNHCSNRRMMNDVGRPSSTSSTEPTSCSKMEGIENAIHSKNNNAINIVNGTAEAALSSAHRSLASTRLPLQTARTNTTYNSNINSNIRSNNDHNAAPVNKLSVSFAAEPTTLASTLPYRDNNHDDDDHDNANSNANANDMEQQEEKGAESPQANDAATTTATSSSSSSMTRTTSTTRISILDATATTAEDDSLFPNRPYGRSRRQRRSVGYYRWLATNSPNEYVDMNGNPRTTTLSGTGNENEDDEVETTSADARSSSSSESEQEEESEHAVDQTHDNHDEEDEEEDEETNIIVKEASALSTSPRILESPTVHAKSRPLNLAQGGASASSLEQASSCIPPAPAPASPPSASILSQQGAKNQIVAVATPLRRSPRKRQSIMPEENEEEQVVAARNAASTNEGPIQQQAAPSAFLGPSSPPGRIIPSRPSLGRTNVQRGSAAVMNTPIRRRSPRKRRAFPEDGDDDETIGDMMPAMIAEPTQSSSSSFTLGNNVESTSMAKEEPISPPRLNVNAATGAPDSKPDSAGEASPSSSSANEILSPPVGTNVQKVAITTPTRRSPRKRRSIQRDEGSSGGLPSIQELVAPSFPTAAAKQKQASPLPTSTTQASANASSCNETLSQPADKARRTVIATPNPRSPRKRQSIQGNETIEFPPPIAEAVLSPISKVSSPSADATMTRALSSKITYEMTFVTQSLSNTTIQSPADADAEMNTPVTQSPLPSPLPNGSDKKQQQIFVTTTTPIRWSPRKKRAVEANEGNDECSRSPFATAELSPIKRETTSPIASFPSPKVRFLSPQQQQQLPSQKDGKVQHDSLKFNPVASTALLSQFSQPPEEHSHDSESSVTMDADESMEMECTTPLNQELANRDMEDKDDEQKYKTSKSFVLEYSLEHEHVVIHDSKPLDESTFRALEASNGCKVRIVYDQSPHPPPKGILRRNLRYTKPNDNHVEMKKERGITAAHEEEEFDEMDDISLHGITLPELKHRMAILFPTDYSHLIQSSCDSARLIACFTLYKDALFVENESVTQPQQQQPPAKTAARARTRRRRLSLESKTPGINYLQPILPLLSEIVRLELVQYQSMSMAKEENEPASTSGASDVSQGTHRVHFPAFDGSALQPPSDVIEGSDRVREESIEQLTKVVKASQTLFGRPTGPEEEIQQSESSGTKFDARRMAINVLQNLVQYLQTEFVTHGHAAPCSTSFPFKSHTFSRVEKAAQSYAHDLSHVLRNSQSEETPECPTFPHPSHDISIANRISQSSRCGPFECRLADNAGQQIRYWLRTLLNPIPDRAPPKSSSNSAKAKQWRCRICDIVALCVEDAEQSMAVEDGSMSSLVSDALSFLHALFGVSSWQAFVAGGEPSEVKNGNERKLDAFFSSPISLRQDVIQSHQWAILEDELIAATEFLAAMNGVRFLYELFSIVVKEQKYHKVWKKTIQELAETLALVDEACIQEEDVQLLLLKTPLEEILEVLEKISQQHSSKYIQCQNQLKEFSKRFEFGMKSKRKKRHQPDLGYLETAYEETMEKINFPRAMRL